MRRLRLPIQPVAIGALVALPLACAEEPASPSASAYVSRARTVLAADPPDRPAAREALLVALEQEPDNAAAWCLLGSNTHAQGRDPEAAVAELRRCCELRPDDAERHVELGQALVRTGDLRSARDALARAVELAPQRAEAHAGLGQVAEQLKEPGAALGHYAGALQLEPTDAATHFRRGNLARSQGDDAAAESHLEAHRLLLARDRAWRGGAPPEERAAILSELLARLPRALAVRTELADLMQAQGRFAAAAELWGGALELHGPNPDYEMWRALMLVEAGDLDAAGQALDALYERDREHPNTAVVAGALAAARGYAKEAKGRFERALAADRDHVEAHWRLADLLRATGDPAAAAEHLQHCVRLDPDNAQLRSNLGSTLRQARRYDDAIRELERAVKLAPSWPVPLNNLGLALAERGRTTASVAAFERAIELAPSFGRARLNFGLVLLQMDEPEAAIEHLEASRRLLPDDPAPASALERAYAATHR